MHTAKSGMLVRLKRESNLVITLKAKAMWITAATRGRKKTVNT